MKRSAFKPKAPARRPVKQIDYTPRPRATVPLKKCAVRACHASFLPARGFVTWCSPECGAVIAQQKIEKARAAALRKEARDHRAKLDDSKPLQHWLKLTEGVVNHFIQTRDKGLPCISCGTRRTVQWEAGHFLSVGARPELRFDPRNINLQCHRCNVQLSGNQAAYRIGLEAKIGEAAVQELEGPHATAKFTREVLASIRKQFAADTRALKRAA